MFKASGTPCYLKGPLQVPNIMLGTSKWVSKDGRRLSNLWKQSSKDCEILKNIYRPWHHQKLEHTGWRRRPLLDVGALRLLHSCCGNVVDFVLYSVSNQTNVSLFYLWGEVNFYRSINVQTHHARTRNEYKEQFSTQRCPILFQRWPYLGHFPISECNRDVKSPQRSSDIEKKTRVKDKMDCTANIPQCKLESGNCVSEWVQESFQKSLWV